MAQPTFTINGTEYLGNENPCQGFNHLFKFNEGDAHVRRLAQPLRRLWRHRWEYPWRGVYFIYNTTNDRLLYIGATGAIYDRAPISVSRICYQSGVSVHDIAVFFERTHRAFAGERAAIQRLRPDYNIPQYVTPKKQTPIFRRHKLNSSSIDNRHRFGKAGR